MILPLLGLAVLAIVILAFIIEPVLRARGDAVVLDAVAMPRPEEEFPEDPVLEQVEPIAVPHDQDRRPAHSISPAMEPRPASDAT